MPGFTKKQMSELRKRDDNRSAWTGEESDTLVPQHRANRGMGGSPSRNVLSNAVLLESIINGLIESDPEWQAEAIRRGIKVSLHADPRMVPVVHAVHGECWLTDTGEAVPVGNEHSF